ncbi:MAG: class I tRNA ligase family protein, partial [Patescibacteria group bacterium]
IEPMIENFRLNTVISEAMKLLKIWENGPPGVNTWRQYLVTLAPIFPHLTEELWQSSGGNESIFKSRWPVYAAGGTETQSVSIRHNHRHLGSITVPPSASQEKLLEIVSASDLAAKIGQLETKRVVAKVDFIDFIDQNG